MDRQLLINILSRCVDKLQTNKVNSIDFEYWNSVAYDLEDSIDNEIQ